jgi:hypothetical protein
MFLFFYCVGYPTGIGISFWPPLMCGWEWFPRNKGLVSGLIIGGFGFGPVIFGPITTRIVNPGNIRPTTLAKGDVEKYYGPEITKGVPHMFHVCLGCWAGLALMSVLCVFRNPEYTQEAAKPPGQELQNETVSTEGNQDEKELVDARPMLTLADALRTRRFWHLGAMLFLGIFYGGFVTSVYKTVA